MAGRTRRPAARTGHSSWRPGGSTSRPRPGGSVRPTRRTPPSTSSRSRSRGQPSLLAWWFRAEPPGGWLLATILAIGAAVAGGLVFPQSPPGQWLRSDFGIGAPLALAWPLWLGWSIGRRRSVPPVRTGSLLVLSAAALAILALGSDGGGSAGRALVGMLDEGFGRVGGLAVLVIATAGALVAAIGAHRVVLAVAAAGSLAHRLAEPRPAAIAVARRRPERGLVREAAGPQATPESDMVILGPPTPSSQPEPVAPAPRPAAPRRSDAPGHVAWMRPDPKLLGTAVEAGSFSPSDLRARARIIEETLTSFGVQARVAEVQQGPAITQFGLDPAPGVAVSRIVSRQNDLALRLGAPSLRVLAPVPGRPLVGLEVPNTSVATVKLGDLLAAPGFAKARLPIGIGMDVAGKAVVADLARMPHLLIAGATGAGKSVCINSLVASLLVSRTPDEVQLVLVDPKQVEMSQYKGLPHLRLPVVTDMDKVVATLRWTVQEMERRYTRFSEVGARNIVAFNERFPEERLSYLVIVIDELADMMMTAAEDVERLICRLAQLGRAAGVHLVVATQRPSVDVLTGLIKANLPTRIAFAVSSQTDSRVILDRAGAERLLGRGDGLYQAGDEMNPRRFQGAFIADDEIEAICNHWRAQALPRHTEEDEEELEKLARQDDPEEKLLAQARAILHERGMDVTTSYLQRRLKIGHQKAARIHQALVADEAAARSSPPPEEGA